MNAPTTLTEIRNAASSMFSDIGVHSVNVEASFGLVTVDREGNVKMASDEVKFA